MPTQNLYEHCSVESSDGILLIGDARVSLNGESPHSNCAFGGYTEHGRARVDDRITNCEVKDTSDGGCIITGTQRGAVVRKGVSEAEAKITIKVTPGRYKGKTAALQYADQ